MSSGLLTIADDDLVDVAVGKPPVAQYVNGLDTKPLAAPATDDLDVDWDDPTPLTTGGLDRIVPADKHSVVRFALLSKAKVSWVHFFPKDGKLTPVRCHSVRDKMQTIQGEPAICCKHAKDDERQQAQLTILALALEYKNIDSKTGRFQTDTTGAQLPISYRIGYVKLSGKGFEAVKSLAKDDEDGKANADVQEIDILMSKLDNGGYVYKRATRAAKYRAIPALLADVQASAARYADGVLLKKYLGKVLSLVDLKLLLLGNAAHKPAAQIHDTDDL